MPNHHSGSDNASEHNTAPAADSSAQKPSFFKTMMHKVISGGIAGAVEVLVDHPWWTLKTRFQNDDIPTEQKMPRNFKELRGLYQGLRPNMLSMVPITALQVSSAAALQTALSTQSQDGTVTPAAALAANSMGGALSATVSGPTEFVMSHQNKARGFVATMKEMVKQHGISSLKTGMGGTAIRDGIFTAGYLSVKPYLTQQLSPYLSENQAKLVGGVTAGVGAALLSQPFDALKSAQQTSKCVTPMWQMAMDVLRKEGIAGLYKGSIPRTIRVMAAIPILGTVEEEVNKRLSRHP